MKCIYCNKESDNLPLAVCKKCTKIWNENWEKFIPVNEEEKQLEKDCAEYIKQAMTGHTCGQERCIGGDIEGRFGSSDCIGCCPDTIHHYSNAAKVVIAWTKNWIEKNIMKNVLLKRSRD